MGYEVSSGQVVIGISLTNDYMYVLSGGVVNETAVNEAGSMFVEAGGSANETTVNESGSMSVAGVANKTVLNGSGYWGLGEMNVHDGGVANSTTVNSGGSMSVDKAGTADTTTVNDCGSMHVSSGGAATVTTVNSGGSVYIDRGGSADTTTVNAGGILDIQNGGTATLVRENGGYVNIAADASATFVANEFSGVTLLNCSATLHSGTTATATAVDDFGRLYVFSGGLANSTTVNSDANLYVYSGGAATDTTVNDCGSMHVLNGGAANAAAVNSGGSMYVDKGGAATDTTVNDGGDLHVSGTADGTTVNGVDELNCGELYIHGGGVANSTTVNSFGWMCIASDGAADGLTVNSGGNLIISAGGEAISIRENGGYVDVADGANVTFVENVFRGLTLSAGSATLHAGTTANDTAVNTSGELYVYSGGTANGTVLTGTDSTNCAELYVYDGGTANNTTLNVGGWMYVGKGGMAGATTVNADGYLGIAAGGKHTGTLTITENAVVSAYAGSVLDFDISGANSGNAALVNDLSRVQGTPDYTLTVSATQATGSYRLAGGAAGFDKTLTVNDASGVDLGSLSVDGGTVEIGGVPYTLLLNGADLTVNVGDFVPENKPDDGRNNWLYDRKTKEWNPDAGEFVVNEVKPGDSLLYLDQKQTVAKEGRFNFLGRAEMEEGLRDDPADYAKITLEKGAALTFSVDSTVDGTFYVYASTANRSGVVPAQCQKIAVKANKVSPAKPTTICLAAGKYYIGMETKLPSAKKAPEVSAFYNVNLTGTKFFDDADDGWNNSAYETDPETGKEDKTKLNTILVDEALVLGRDTTDIDPDIGENWVGFGDDTDYKMLKLDNAVNLTLNFTATGKAKLTIWKVSTNAKSGKISLTSKGSVTVKPDKTGAINAKFLDVGDYFISVASTDAEKGGSAYYNVTADPTSVFFDSADDGRNNVLYDKKNKTVYGEDAAHHFVVNEISGGGQAFFLDDNEIGDQDFGNFVGYQDKVDYAKFTMTEQGKLSFTVTATEGATFEVWTLANGKMKSLGRAKLKLGKDETVCTGTVSNHSLEVGTEYYVSMTAAKTTANAKGSVFYNVLATLTPQNIPKFAMPETDSVASALSMPEADTLGISDALTFGNCDTDALASASASSLSELDDKSGWMNIASLA